MSSLQGFEECLELLAVLFLEFGDLARQRDDDGVVGVGGLFGRGLLPGAAQMLDPCAQFGVDVEKGVGDAGFALHGLERDGLAALNQSADGLFGVSGFVLRLGFRCFGRAAIRRSRESVMGCSCGGG